MRKPKPFIVRIYCLLVCLTCTAAAQGTFPPPRYFFNLGFEYPQNVPAEPSPPPWGWDPMIPSDAFPSWMTYIGEPEAEIWHLAAHNTWYGGTPSVALFDLHSPYVIEGGYSVGLKSGFDLSGNALSASVAQTALIPSDSQSLQIKIANGSSGFRLSISGEDIPLTLVQAFENHVLYAGDVSRFSGVTNELRVSVAGGESRVLFDSIAFSPEAIPEPRSSLLAGMGILLFISKMRVRKALP